MSGLSRRQLGALAVIAAGEDADSPARVSDHTTPASVRWRAVHYRTARTLIDRGLVRDEMRPSGDGLYLTADGRTALEQGGAA